MNMFRLMFPEFVLTVGIIMLIVITGCYCGKSTLAHDGETVPVSIEEQEHNQETCDNSTNIEQSVGESREVMIETSGGPVVVFFQFDDDAEKIKAQDVQDNSMELTRDGEIIGTWPIGMISIQESCSRITAPGDIIHIDRPGAGLHKYEMDVRVDRMMCGYRLIAIEL
jgi:hypothetical protein